MKLYPYQETAIEKSEAWLAEDDHNMRCAIVLPTGAGKTITFSAMAKRLLERFPDKRVLILVHTDELARQTVKALRKQAEDLIIGVVKARENETTADVIVGSVQTLRNPKRLAQIRDVCRVIVDECDLAAAPSYMRILEHFGCFRPGSGVKAVGVTATLYRTDGRIGTVWQDVPFSLPLTWMIRKQFLIPPRGIAVTVPDLNLRSVGQTKKDFREGDLGEALADSLAPELVAQAIVEHAADRKILAFFPTVASSYVFAEAINAAGIPAEVIHGGLPQSERDAILARHKRGTCVVNCMILTVGYDDPEVDAIVIGRPTKSKRLYVQIVGRGLRVDKSRPYEEQDCLLLDVVGAGTEHDLRSMADLSEKPLDPEKVKSGRSLTELEDEFDAGEGVEEDEPAFYRGETIVKEFDPIGRAKRSKVWLTTSKGTHFVPSGGDAYVFIAEYPKPGSWSVFWATKHPSASFFVCSANLHTNAREPVRRERVGPCCKPRGVALANTRPLTLEEAMDEAEILAVDFGADVGFDASGKKASWRKKAPSPKLVSKAQSLGVAVDGTAGEVSDRIGKIEGTRRIDPLVAKVRNR